MDYTETLQSQDYVLENLATAANTAETNLNAVRDAVAAYNESVENYRTAHAEATNTFAAPYLESLGFGDKKFVDAQFAKKFADTLSE